MGGNVCVVSYVGQASAWQKIKRHLHSGCSPKDEPTVIGVNFIARIKKPDAVKLYRAILLYGGAVGFY